jgi:hypothetical protein
MSEVVDVSATVKAVIQAHVIQAFNSMPETVEKLVKAALERPVEQNGKFASYTHNGTMPYLDWLVGEEIRQAASAAVRKVIQESLPQIEAKVREGLSAESVVAAVTNSLIGVAKENWRINVNFEADKGTRY